MHAFIQQFAILFLVVVVVSFIVKLMRQPIIIGYVISGILFSLYALQDMGEQVILLSELGITFLLFLMGLEFDFKSLRYYGKDILITTAIQSAVFGGIAFTLGYLFGFGIRGSIYVALLFMFSSTLLVAKWIEDKKETSTVHGKIVLGTLIMQDVLAIIGLTILSMNAGSWQGILLAPFKGLLLLAIAFVLARYVMNTLLKFAAKYPELLFIFSLGICFLFVELAPILGYSTSIGAFIAGVMLANTIYHNEVSGKLKSLIIFFNMLFFIGLGYQMRLDLAVHVYLFAGILCALSLLVKPVVAYVTFRLRGYDIKTSFLSAVYLAQLSEFGIIIVAAAGAAEELTSIAIICVIFTMILSSYYIKYDKKLFARFEKYIRAVDRITKTKDAGIEQAPETVHVLFFGYYEISKQLFDKASSIGKHVLVVEQDPENIEQLRKEGIPYYYGSPSNPDLFEHVKIDEVELVVSSIIDVDENIRVIKEIKHVNPKALVIVTAKNTKDSLTLYSRDADYVIYPHYLNEQHVSVLVEDYTQGINRILDKKLADMERLKESEKRESADFLNIDMFLKNLAKDIKREKP